MKSYNDLGLLKKNRLLSSFLKLMTVGLFLNACTVSESIAQFRKKPSETASTSPKTADNEAAVLKMATKFLLRDSSSAVVFLKIEFNQNINFDFFAKNFTVNYALYPDFGSKERLGYGNIIPDQNNTIQLDANHFLVTITPKRPSSNPSMMLMLTEAVKIGSAQKATKDLMIRYRTSKLSDRLALYDKKGQFPQMKNYLTINDTFAITGVGQPTRQLYVYRYKHDFDAAFSPMNTSPRTTARTLKIDSSFRVSTNEAVRFHKEGLYYMVQDTTDTFGIGLYVADKRFPKMTQPVDLIQPVMYMSQNQEITELKAAQNTKKALDKYWLTLMNGNTELAKQTIKAYYKRVEEANGLFTSYKEGWKTDMGMVYIVMGPPDDIRRGRDREIWVYNQRSNFSDINFTFNRRPNQFVEDHYELQRFIEYQPIWYPIVESWRSGVVRD